MQPNSRAIASIAVWAVWALLVLSDFALVWKYGSNVPFSDDFEMVPAICRHVDNFAAWLWTPCAEHRVAVPRLTQWALYKLADNDFRAGMYFNVAALGAITAVMIAIARQLRGYASFTDVFFPLAMLHWGQWENLLWSWQVQFVSSAVLSGVILAVIARGKFPKDTGGSIVVGLSLVLLPLCGANGVALVPPLAIWFVYAGITQIAASIRSWQKVANGVFAIFCALVAVALVGVYLVDFRKTDPEPVDTWRAIQTAGRFLTMSLGPAASNYWPYALFGLLALTALAVWCSSLAFSRQSSERLRAAGLLMFLAGILALAVGLGWGRANLDENYGFVSRYVTLAVPVLVALYFAFLLYLPPIASRIMQSVLVIVVAAPFLPNMDFGWNHARQHRTMMARFERDLHRGDNLSLLAQNHTQTLGIIDWPQLNGFLRMLHDAHIGQFRSMRDNPYSNEVSVPLNPARVRNMDWKDGVGTALNDDPFVVFALERPQFVHAIRLRYLYAAERDERGGAHGELYWCDSQRNEFSDKERRLTWTTTPHETERTIWIDDTIDQIRFDPDNRPCEFTLKEVTLLVPVNGR